MKKDIKVIIMDIDGTLTNSEKKITKKTKDVLLKAQEQGILLVIASGRPVVGLTQFAEELDLENHNGLLVGFNGGMVVNYQTKEVLYDKSISISEGKKLLKHLKNFDVVPMVHGEEYLYVEDAYEEIEYKGKMFNMIKFDSRTCNLKVCEVDDLSEYIDFPMHDVIAAASADYLNENYKEMMAPFEDTLSCVFAATIYFEYTAKGADKASALDAVLTKMGYTRDQMIAFGDSQNDITMLEYVGTGVAMENAVDSLKAVADEVTLSNEDDGIAYMLEKYLNL